MVALRAAFGEDFHSNKPKPSPAQCAQWAEYVGRWVEGVWVQNCWGREVIYHSWSDLGQLLLAAWRHFQCRHQQPHGGTRAFGTDLCSLAGKRAELRQKTGQGRVLLVCDRKICKTFEGSQVRVQQVCKDQNKFAPGCEEGCLLFSSC